MLLTAAYAIWQISLSGVILSASTMEASDRLSSLAQKTVVFGMGFFYILYSLCPVKAEMEKVAHEAMSSKM